jgi:glycosyltransferase involved in cell wall biosynthesis
MRAFERQHTGDPRLTAMRAKVQVIYPTVHNVTAQLTPTDGSLRLFFVGRDFMRKGLPVVTRAHARLRSQGIPVLTTIVSSLNWRRRDYIAPDVGYDLDSERARLNQPGIEYLDEISNADILRRMSEAHFTLLPTLHDTFGYSAIESLACGTPIIATNTCAIPEIIEDGVSGALLPLKCDAESGDWEGIAIRYRDSVRYTELYRATVDDLSAKLSDRLLQFWEARGDFRLLRANAANRFHQRFDPIKTRQRLETLYERYRRWAGWFGPVRGLISFCGPPWASNG